MVTRVYQRMSENAGGFAALLRRGGVLLVAAAMLVLAWILVQSPAGNSSIDATVWDGAELALARGNGWRADGAWRLTGGSDGRGSWLLQSPPIEIAATDHAYLRYRIEGLGHGGQMTLVWSRAGDQPGRNRVPLTWSGDGEHLIRLDAIPAWRGEIRRFSLLVKGPGTGPVIIREIAFEPATPGNRIAAAWTEWTALESWSQRSINFAAAPHGSGILHLLPAIAFVVVLAAVLCLCLRRSFGNAWPWRAIAVIFFAGWFAADVLWQRQLLYRLDETRQRYAGIGWAERQTAGLDGGLFRFIRQVKARLPDKPSVIYLITDDADDSDRYLRYRAQYHLRPHNVDSGSVAPPVLHNTRPGEYILVVGDVPRLRYTRVARTLVWRGWYRIPAEPRFTSPHGALYAITW